jgi:hypothetical protein
VETVFKKLFGSTSWEQTALAVITYVAPLLETIVALTAGGPAAALVTAIITTVKADLATLAAVVNGATATPPANELAAAQQALSSIQANLPQILQLAEVKNSANKDKITAIVNTVIGEVEAIAENIPQPAQASAAKA